MRKTPIELTSTIPLELRSVASRVAEAANKNRVPRRVAGFGWFLLVMLVAFGLVLDFREVYPHLSAFMLLLIFLTGHLMAFVEWKLPDRRRLRAQSGHWTRADQANTTLTAVAAERRFISNNGGTYLRCKTVESIVPLSGGLQLHTATGEIIVPLMGLTGSKTRKGILETFDTWRAAQ